MDPRLTETVAPDGVKVRLFSDAAIQADIDKALASLPPGKTGAVTIHADLEGAQAAWALRDGHWSCAVIGEYDWQTRDLRAGAEITYSW